MAQSKLTDKFALFNGDCVEVMKSLPDASVDLAVYSPPFGGLYNYSSDPRDLSNAIDRGEFFDHYAFVVKELYRLTKPGRMNVVHSTDIASGNTGLDHLYDFSGDVIRLHEKLGFKLCARRHIWKEPLTVRNRTMTKSLAHKTIVEDSTRTSIANADQLMTFRRDGKNVVPVTHKEGLTTYAGFNAVPAELHQYRGWKGDQIQNRYSHWIWRQYADAFWLDVRIDRTLPHRDAKEEDDERHVHPLQLDVIERAIVLYSNPGETVLTPFMGVGSEAYGAVINGRRAVGIELKASYYKQAVRNMEVAGKDVEQEDFKLEAETA